jgi:drug/metabolite transporter (DMT)-like permease
MLFFGPSHALYYYALQHTSTTEGTALGTTSPIWTATFAFVFLREKVGGRRFAALVVGLIGAYIVSIGFALPQVNAGHTYGNLIYLLATIMESAVTVIAAPIARRSSGITVLAWEVSGAAFALILISSLHLPGMEFAIKAPSLSGVLAISYLVLVAGMMCFAGWYMLVESAPVSLLVVSLMLQPPLAAIVGYFAFGEKITRDLVIGSVVILGALVLDAET